MTWIQTFTGRKVDLENPTLESISIKDIAHALAHICRFTGHTERFYSVAEHSVRVSLLLPEHLALAGLLHDTHEAYIGDMSAPLKQCAVMSVVKVFERHWQRVIEQRFGLAEGSTSSKEVKHADLVMLATEKRDLFGAEPVRGWEPWDAKQRFLEVFDSLRD